MRGKALVGVMSLVLALSAAMLFAGCADSSFREAAAAKDDSAIDWGGMTAAEAREMIESGELDPNGVYAVPEKRAPGTPLARVVVARNGDLDVLNVLVENGADLDHIHALSMMTALDVALLAGEVNHARRLLELGASMNLDDDGVEKNPAIFWVLGSVNTSLDARKEMIDLLLAHGVDIDDAIYIKSKNPKSGNQVTSLLNFALLSSRSAVYPKDDFRELVSFLLSRGADPNSHHPDDVSPMHWATLVSADAVGELLQSGGNVNILARYGDHDYPCVAPLFYFATGGDDMEVFDFLIAHGAKLDNKCGGKGILDVIAERKGGHYDEIFNNENVDIGNEKFSAVEEWRGFGDVILARIGELCETEEYAVCQELSGRRGE